MDIATNNITAFFHLLEEIVESDGPDDINFSKIEEICDSLMKINLSVKEENNFYEILKPILNINSMIGHTFHKPYGYAGDFELINRIYTNWITKDKKYQKWDHLYQWTNSAKAVRNRKQYFIDQINKTTLNNDSPTVLNLGSGPCTDVFEYFQTTPKSLVKFECLDMDDKAIEFGSAVCDNYIDSIIFIKKNVFLFNSQNKYDLIWSAGLFDYFNDKLFVRLINRYFNLLNNGGELVIGNFSKNNPSRGLMEVLCQWYLYHRSEENLTDLALKAGVPKENIVIKAEETGINLFMHISK